MILDNEPIFDNCLIKTNSKKIPISLQNQQDNNLEKDNQNKIDNVDNLDKLEPLENTTLQNDLINTNSGLELDIELDLGKENTMDIKNEPQNLDYQNSNEVNFDFHELPIEEFKDETELEEVDINVSLENDLEQVNNETIFLKKPNEVYYELYKEAREKAKLARKNAIIAYLEAKNIKKTYMLESLDESESDIDAEIDEVSESELEGL
jgi:hypothetical protein